MYYLLYYLLSELPVAWYSVLTTSFANWYSYLEFWWKYWKIAEVQEWRDDFKWIKTVLRQ